MHLNPKRRKTVLMYLQHCLLKLPELIMTEVRSWQMRQYPWPEKKHDIKLEVSGYINKGYCHELNYEDSIAVTFFRKAFEISDEKNYDDGKAEALFR